MDNINKTLLRLTFIITLFLGLLIPKEKKLVSISSHNGEYYKGNAKALFEYLEKDGYLTAYYFIRNLKKVRELSKKHRNICYLYNLKSILTLLRSKTIIITHSSGDFYGVCINPFIQNIIHLHHGGGSRKTKYLCKENENGFLKTYFERKRYWAVSSDFTRYFFAAREGLDARKVFVTGMPRNDILFKHKSNSRKSIKNILYAPHWIEEGYKNIFSFSDFKINTLQNFLEKYGFHLYVRFHPHGYKEIKKEYKYLFKLEKVHDISPDKLEDVQDIFHEIDLIITDSSSIYLDFICINKPVIFIQCNFDFPLSKDIYCPGPMVNSFEDLINKILEYSNLEDKYENKRKNLINLLNNYTDGGSCKRIKNLIIELS